MRYLPELERELFEAARRRETHQDSSAKHRSRTRRWRRTPLLAGAAALLLAGAAAAAATGVLESGKPVPAREDDLLRPAGDDRFVLSHVRAPDPDGGPDWGIGTYDAEYRLADDFPEEPRLTCVVIGRVQNGQLGVVGRDGVFANDGRFHPLNASSQTSGGCGGHAPDSTFISISSEPAVPASGYTGPPGTTIGGCRERVDLNGPTVSPQTRKKLRDVPQCDTDGLRYVIAGFAGPLAANATLTSQGQKFTQQLDGNENGPYLFVVPGDAPRPSLIFTLRDGTTCRATQPCPGLLR